MMNESFCDKKFFLTKYRFVSLLIITSVVKQLLVCGLPIWARDSVGADEYLMLSQAESLIRGEYLGDYNQFTLVKGMMFPLFLCICNIIGLSYLNAVTLLYTIASLIALYVFGHFCKNRFIQYVFFLMILFCPVTYSSNTLLVYRDSLLPGLAIILICSLMLMYLNLNVNLKKFVFWSFVASLDWFFLCNTREDTIWTKPLIVVVVAVLVINIYLQRKLIIKKICYIFFSVLPILFLVLGNNVLSYINYVNYGVYTTNELDDSNYTDAALLLMKIKPSENVENVTITRDALNQAYEVSPSLSELKEIIEYDYDNRNPLTRAGNNPNNGEFDGDYITWELRGAASARGYYESAKSAEEYWGKVEEELKIGFDDGRLKERNIVPSRSLIPWPENDNSLSSLVVAIFDLFDSASSYNKCRVENIVTDPMINDEVIKRYEGVTGNYALDSPQYDIGINGWIFIKSENNICTVNIEDEFNNVIYQDKCEDSMDVYNGYLTNQNKEYENAKNARFDFKLKLSDLNGISLVVRDENGEVVGKVDLSNPLDEYWISDAEHAFDNFNIEIMNEPRFEYAQNRIERLQFVSGLYKVFNKYITLIAVLIYFVKTIKCIIFVKRREKHELDSWLYESALAGSILVYIGGLGYVHAFMYPITGYLTGIYALLQVFTATVFFLFVYRIIICIKNRKWEK